MQLEIRRATSDDITALADFIKDLKHFRRLAGLSQEAVRGRVRGQMELLLADADHSLYIAQEAESQIVGYISVHWLPYLFLPGPEGYVSELFVSQAARGHGVGTRLLQVVKEEARFRGCARLSLLNMRDRESYQHGFYAKDGWEERADAANFIFDLRPDAHA
ncbi:MAG: GNAT family N-acetyltransferase [Nitrososphaerales archaeon]